MPSDNRYFSLKRSQGSMNEENQALCNVTFT